MKIEWKIDHIDTIWIELGLHVGANIVNIKLPQYDDAHMY